MKNGNDQKGGLAGPERACPCQWQQGLQSSEKPRDNVTHRDETVWSLWLSAGDWARRGKRTREVNQATVPIAQMTDRYGQGCDSI